MQHPVGLERGALEMVLGGLGAHQQAAAAAEVADHRSAFLAGVGQGSEARPAGQRPVPPDRHAPGAGGRRQRVRQR